MDENEEGQLQFEFVFVKEEGEEEDKEAYNGEKKVKEENIFDENEGNLTALREIQHVQRDCLNDEKENQISTFPVKVKEENTEVNEEDPIFLVDDNECILVEFCNDNKLLAVGFKCWVAGDLNEEHIRRVIDDKTQVEVSWPNVDIKPARFMKTAMKRLLSDDWTSHAVIILAFGDWKTMTAQRECMVKLNVLGTTKKSRRLLMKKKFDDDYHNIAGKGGVPSNSTKATLKKRNLKRKVEARKRFVKIAEITETRNKKSENSTSEEEGCSSEDEPKIKKNKADLEAEVTNLRAENERLKTELTHYKNIVLLEKKAEKILLLFEKLNEYATESCKHPSYNNTVVCCSTESKSSKEKEKSGLPQTTTISEENELEAIQNCSTEKKNSEVSHRPSLEHFSKNAIENPRNEESIDRSLKLTVDAYTKLRKKDMRVLILNLFNSRLFNPEDFLMTTASGRKSAKSKMSLPKLDIKKIEIVKDIVQQHFPGETEKIDYMIKKIVVNKCKNAKKVMKVKEL